MGTVLLGFAWEIEEEEEEEEKEEEKFVMMSEVMGGNTNKNDNKRDSLGNLFLFLPPFFLIGFLWIRLGEGDLQRVEDILRE
jgi:hypothetical protein